MRSYAKQASQPDGNRTPASSIYELASVCILFNADSANALLLTIACQDVNFFPDKDPYRNSQQQGCYHFTSGFQQTL